MTNYEISTEEKILSAASKIFLLYGYHGTRLRQIAEVAGVNSSVIHYYFRSKENLFKAVVKKVMDLVIVEKFDTVGNKFENLTRFFCIELHNNRDLFIDSLKYLYPDDWENVLKKIEYSSERRDKGYRP